MKKGWIAVAVAAAAVAAPTVQAQQAGDVVVRARAVYIDPADKDSIASVDVSVSTKTIPEVDFTYFFSPNLAAELVLTYPQKHDVSANGTKIGTLKHLPPTLTVQYHFPLGAVKPYVGAGLNYTHFSSVNLPAGYDIDRNSWGLAVQGGLDWAIDKQWSFNVDLKKVGIRTDLSVNGANAGTIKVDPWLFGVGVGYKF